MGSGWRRVMQDLGESQVDQLSGAQQSKSCPFRIIELLFFSRRKRVFEKCRKP